MASLSSRYQILDRLGEGGMGVVHRALDRLTGQTVALKRVTLDSERLTFTPVGLAEDLRVTLASEFRTLASLRHPNIISVLDYGFDEEARPYFTMELLTGTRSLLDAGRDADERRKVELLADVLRALAYLHRHGVIHRDLKPDNVLVTAAGQVKVLDFGVAVRRGQIAEAQVAGTLRYMAPELLCSEPAGPASDLYAVGVMAYELFAGQHPYGDLNPREPMSWLYRRPPDLGPVRAAPELVALIGRLLSNLPDDRPESATQALSLLSASSGLSLPRETSAIRESFLQAAPFVGRKAELARLDGALGRMLVGEGSTWLIGGESGVGKTRLVDELRSRALVERVAVVRGQAVSDGGRPLHVWGEILRQLVLSTSLDDREASVLRQVVPDIAALLERPVPDAPALEAQSAFERLLHAIDGVLARQAQPTLLLLEDLHWEGQDSLAVLKRAVRNPRLMIVGTYRDDETPGLPRELPEAQVMRLARLPPEDTAALTAAMLGSAGRSPRLLDFLQRQTEGNALFLVQVVRALAERVHALDELDAVALPESLLVGGIRNVVERRLARLPEGARPLLELAAVAGDRVDERVLRAAAPEVDLTGWLHACAERAVLSIEDGFRFAHHKVREIVLAGLSPGRRRALHGQVAEAIERAHPGAAPFAAELAYHHREGGRLDRAAPYALQAGAAALESGAAEDAARWLREAAASEAHLPARDRVRALRMLAEALFARGQLVEAQGAAERACVLAGWDVPRSTPALLAGTAGQLCRHVAYRLLRFPMPRPALSEEMMAEGLRAGAVASTCALWLGQTLKTLFATVRAFNVTELLHGTPDYAASAARLAYITRVLGMKGLFAEYERRIAAGRAALPDALLPAVTYPLGVAHFEQGRWDEAFGYMEEGVAAARRAGDDIQWAVHRTHIHFMEYVRGTLAGAKLDEVEQVARRTGNAQVLTWVLLLRACVDAVAGRSGAALSRAEEARALSAHTHEFTAQIALSGALPALYLYEGDRDTAARLAREGLRLAASRPILANCGLEGLPTLVLTFHALGQRREARRAFRLLGRMARSFPILRPRTLFWDYKLTGRRERLIEGLAEAERLGMPLEQAVHLQALGETARADAILRRIQATYFMSDQPGGRLILS